MTAVRSPFTIKRRILEGRKLWGVVIQNQGKAYQKMDVADLLKLMIIDNRTVLIDFPGSDQPSVLAVVNEQGIMATGKYYFRTIKDNIQMNNFNQVPAVKLISCNKLKCLKI